jgi:sialic acid synthase SpsE
VLEEISGRVVGYSDHTMSVDTGGLAVAVGARVLEKHLTYDRHATGPDHGASLEPTGLAEYVRLAHRAFAMVGAATKDVDPIERDVRSVSRQSVVAVRNLAAGHMLDHADLTLKRPGGGVPPDRLSGLVGRTLAVAVTADTPLREDDLA